MTALIIAALLDRIEEHDPTVADDLDRIAMEMLANDLFPPPGEEDHFSSSYGKG